MHPGWDEKIYKSLAPKRSRFFRPLALVLSKLGIHPDAISYLGLAFMGAFAYYVPTNRNLAFWLVIGALLTDQLDGALARYNKTATDRGKFVDIVVDTTNSAIFLFGLSRASIISSSLAMATIYLISLGKVLSTIKKNIGRKSDWLFYSGAEVYQNLPVYGPIIIFLIDTYSRFNIYKVFLNICIVILLTRIVYDYYQIRYKAKV